MKVASICNFRDNYLSYEIKDSIGYAVRQNFNLNTNIDDYVVMEKVEEDLVEGIIVSKVKVDDEILDSDKLMNLNCPLHISLAKTFRPVRICCQVSAKFKTNVYMIHADDKLEICFFEFCNYVNIDNAKTKFWTNEMIQVNPNSTMYEMSMAYSETMYCT